jgi:hypothetical protein
VTVTVALPLTSMPVTSTTNVFWTPGLVLLGPPMRTARSLVVAERLTALMLAFTCWAMLAAVPSERPPVTRPSETTRTLPFDRSAPTMPSPIRDRSSLPTTRVVTLTPFASMVAASDRVSFSTVLMLAERSTSIVTSGSPAVLVVSTV